MAINISADFIPLSRAKQRLSSSRFWGRTVVGVFFGHLAGAVAFSFMYFLIQGTLTQGHLFLAPAAVFFMLPVTAAMLPLVIGVAAFMQIGPTKAMIYGVIIALLFGFPACFLIYFQSAGLDVFFRFLRAWHFVGGATTCGAAFGWMLWKFTIEPLEEDTRYLDSSA